MSTFWWEETYDPKLKVDNTQKTRIPTDNTGEAFLKHRITTSSSQLSGLITPSGDMSIVLGDSGRVQSAVSCYKNSTGELVRTILVESKSGFMDLSSDGEILAVGVLKEDTIMIFHVMTGEFLASVRGDRPKGFWGQLQFLPGSINYMIEHRVIEMQRSTAKKSVLRMWDLGFRSHPSNGEPIKLGLEQTLEVVSSNSSKSNSISKYGGVGGGSATASAEAKSSDKNQKDEVEDEEEEEVDDEDAAQLWSTDMEGPACFAFNPVDGKVLLNLENKREIQYFKATDGQQSSIFKSPLPPKLRAIIEASEASAPASSSSSSSSASSAAASSKKPSSKASGGRMTPVASAKPSHNIKPIQIENESWSTKCILSRSAMYFAVGHFGRVTVMDCSSGAIVGEVFSPIEDDTYPLIPLAFILDDNFLVCRINYDRILMVMSWRLPKAMSMTYALKDLGGTISDACAVSPDGKTLLCWPFGSVEIYDLSSVATAMFRKYRRQHIVELARIRSYLHKKVAANTKVSIFEGLQSRSDKVLFSFLCLENQEIFANVFAFL